MSRFSGAETPSIARLSLGIALAVGGLWSTAVAQDDFFSTIDIDLSADNDRTDFSVVGWAVQKIGWGLAAPGPLFSRQDEELSQVETSLFAQLDSKLGDNIGFRISGKLYHDEIYRVQADNDYSEDELNEFRNRYEIRDLYVETELDNGLYLRLGHQILAWGQAEFLRVTDLINIEDQYTFGQQDLEDLRLQVPALLASYTAGDWVLDAVVTVDAGRNNIAPAGDEFDQLLSLRNTGMDLQRVDPKRDHEQFLRASTRLAQGDLQLVAGEFNDNALSVSDMVYGPEQPLVRLSQNRMRALGVAANWVEGQWLYFGELGLHKDVALRPADAMVPFQAGPWQQRDQVLAVAGMEYNGFRNLRLSFEVDGIHTKRHDASLWVDEQQVGVGARLFWTALNERFQLMGVWNRLTNDAGQIGRLSLEYNWSDNLDFALLWVDYRSDSDSIFHLFENNDVLQLQLQYSFQY